MNCSICLELHSTKECPDRKPENCPDCDVFIKTFSDHTLLCGMKTWINKPYPDLYATPPLERLIVGSKAPILFLHGGIWQKLSDGDEFYSPESGILIRFKNEMDFAVLIGKFASIRIAFVVKEMSKFIIKLMILASKARFIVAANINEPLGPRNASKSHQWKTTLIITTTSPANNTAYDIMTLPPPQLANRHEIRYNDTTKRFVIPQGLNMESSLFENLNVNRQANNQLMLSQVMRIPLRKTMRCIELIKLNQHVFSYAQ